MYHAVKSLSNVADSSLLVSHTAAQSTQAVWLPLLRGLRRTTTTTTTRTVRGPWRYLLVIILIMVIVSITTRKVLRGPTSYSRGLRGYPEVIHEGSQGIQDLL